MTWEALFALEHGFLELLRDRARSPEHRLLTMIELVRNLAENDDAPLDKSAVDRELLTARVDGFDDLSHRFLLAAGDVDVQLEFVLGMLGERLKAGLRRGWEIMPLETAFERWTSVTQNLRRESFLTDYREFYVDAPDESLRMLENYLVCRVSGNPDFVLADVHAGLKAVAALVALIRAVSVSLAAAADTPVTPRIMSESVRAVDTAFFHLPDFAEAVGKHRSDPASLLVLTPS
jgi:hypothetical protein